MDVDIAVPGGGPGGNEAAIRAAQLSARVARIHRAIDVPNRKPTRGISVITAT